MSSLVGVCLCCVCVFSGCERVFLCSLSLSAVSESGVCLCSLSLCLRVFVCVLSLCVLECVSVFSLSVCLTVCVCVPSM